MRTESLDLRVYRNATYNETWQITDVDDKPIDLTGASLALKIRAVAGQGPVLATGTITINEPAQGIFTVRIDGAALTSVAGQSEEVRLAYDIRLTYSNGIPAIPVAGQIILTPGVTY